MQLLQVFQFKGMYQRGKKVSTPVGYFRRFTNSFKNKNGRILPYGKGEATASNAPTNLPFTSNKSWYALNSLPYKGGILQFKMGEYSSQTIGALRYSDKENNAYAIMQPFKEGAVPFCTELTKHKQYLPSGNISSAIVLDKAFFASCVDVTKYAAASYDKTITPEEKYLISFDGLRARGAGLPLPWTAVDPSGTFASHYVRTVYATIGMDSEVIFSPFLQQRLSSATRDVYLGGYSTYSTTIRADVVGNANVVPTVRQPYDSLFDYDVSKTYGISSTYKPKYFDKRFISITTPPPSVPTAGVLSFTRGIASPGIAVGDWVMLHLDHTLWGLNFHLAMFKVKTISSTAGTTVTLEKEFKYLDNDTITWTDGDYENVWTQISALPGADFQWLGLFAQIKAFSNTFQIISYSTTETAGYRVGSILPVCWDSTLTSASVILNSVFDLSHPFMGQVTSYMADWYDTSVSRTIFPALLGVTSYKNLLVGHDRNAIYFSDTSMGGSTEMVSGESNFVPFGTEFGEITAICGAEDFMLICREHKNFVLRGDLGTGAVSVTECDLAIPGALNSRCCANAYGGRIVFMTKVGIYSIGPSGDAIEVSEDIAELFIGSNPDSNLFNKNVFKTDSQKRSDGYDGSFFKIALDAERGFILFLSGSMDTSLNTVVESNILVLDTKDMSWYEFEGNGAMTVEAYNSKLLSIGYYCYIEDGVMRDETQKLVTAWETSGNPSLEKQVTQIKLYGGFTDSTLGDLGCSVKSQKDWIPLSGAKVTDDFYMTTDSDKYFHKKRLDSSKALATSIILESLVGGSFYLDAIEVEGDIIQQGVKK